MLKTDMMRYHGCQVQREIMENAESTTVFDGLNALGRVKWKINKKVYEAARMCREQNISIGTDIPSRTDLELPPEPVEPLRSEAEHESYVQDFRAYRERLYKYDRVIQRNRVRVEGNSFSGSTTLSLHLTRDGAVYRTSIRFAALHY